MTRFSGMFENMVRATNPVQFPAIGLEFFNQIRAFHVCTIHTAALVSTIHT